MKDVDTDPVAETDTRETAADASVSSRSGTRKVLQLSFLMTALQNGNKNIWRSWHLLWVRLARPSTIPVLPRIGHRIQDTFAYGMLGVGISAILFDVGSYAWINSLPGSYYVFFWTVTDFGKAHWSLLPTGFIGLLVLSLNWTRLTRSAKEALHLLFLQISYIFVVVVGSGLVAVVMKWTLGRARPKLSESHGPTYFDFLALDSEFTSFPSGHATTVGAVAICLALLIPSWARMILVLSFWLSISRIMVSAHYPSDVIAGTLFGAAFAWYTARYLASRRLLFKCDPNDRISNRFSSWRVFSRALRDSGLFRKWLSS